MKQLSIFHLESRKTPKTGSEKAEGEGEERERERMKEKDLCKPFTGNLTEQFSLNNSVLNL